MIVDPAMILFHSRTGFTVLKPAVCPNQTDRLQNPSTGTVLTAKDTSMLHVVLGCI